MYGVYIYIFAWKNCRLISIKENIEIRTGSVNKYPSKQKVQNCIHRRDNSPTTSPLYSNDKLANATVFLVSTLKASRLTNIGRFKCFLTSSEWLTNNMIKRNALSTSEQDRENYQKRYLQRKIYFFFLFLCDY